MKKQIITSSLVMLFFALLSFTTDKPTIKAQTQLKGIIGNEISKATLDSLDELIIEVDRENTNVISYRFVFAPQQGDALLSSAIGNKINEYMLRKIKAAKVGDRIIIDKVQAQYDNGLKMICNPGVFTVVE